MLVGLHLQARDAAAVHVDDDALDHRDDLVAGQRILPRLQRRMADLRVDEVHLADVALVLLEGRDLFRVRRPDENRAIAFRPAGVVGGVAEVLHAVGRERGFLAAGDVADPQIPVANERGALAVRRRHVAALRSAASTVLAFAVLARRQRALAARRLRRVDEDRLLALLGPGAVPEAIDVVDVVSRQPRRTARAVEDRKSTRLNSSHGYISYAVFCLKKKKM